MHSQKGSAIISAIFIALLVALIATSIALFSKHLIQEAIAHQSSTHTQYLLDSPIPLIENEIDQQVPFTHSINVKIEKEGVTIRSYATHAQGLLNINAFSHLNPNDETVDVKNLILFLTLIGVKQNTTQLANLLISSLNREFRATGDKVPIYQWPGHPLILPSSVRGIPFITPETYHLLREWITVLPTTALLIPNSLHWPALVALGLSEDNAKALSNCLDENPGIGVSLAMAHCQLPPAIAQSPAIDKITSSDLASYFTVYSYFFSKNREYQKTTLLFRERFRQFNSWSIVWQHSDVNA
jgi:type II secretory pathway component PulK